MITNTINKARQYNLPIKLSNFMFSENDFSKQLLEFFEDSNIPDPVRLSLYDYLENEGSDLKEILNYYFDHLEEQATFTPIFVYSERRQELAIVLADLNNTPSEPGEPGSVLAYVRMSFYGEDFLCSDCSGQLSCSSCAVEVVKGSPQNADMRDEEYDMLSIDPDMVPTDFSRLSCQTLVGSEPLMVIIRKYGQ
tara:strand:- start:155 stop:736 length:582 start_codon:yes stop_codon:yes gene_type:complete